MKILLIEDEAKIAEFVIQGLRLAGHEVTHAQDGEQGLSSIMAAQHDVAVLDLMLPKLDGFQVLQQAKAAEPKLAPEFNFKADSMAMSFAYDSVAHSLNIVMTDKASGEVIRKITYKHMSSDTHQTRMLQGLLLDQQA